MRTIPFQFFIYFTDGRRAAMSLECQINPSAVKENALMEDGRKIVEVDGETAMLDDGETLSVDAAAWGVIPDLAGQVIEDPWGPRTILVGPDNTGKILFTDESEAYLFGVYAKPPNPVYPQNPFVSQRTQEDYDRLVETNRLLQEQHKRLVPALARDNGPDGRRVREMMLEAGRVQSSQNV